MAFENARNFKFCGPSDDPDEQTAVTLGFRHLIIQFKRLAAPILPEPASSRLKAIDVDAHDLYSAFDAKSELDALIPDIESALKNFQAPSDETMNSPTPKPLPVPVCSIAGDVLGSIIFHHKTLEGLFYGAEAVGEVPPGNCVTKCQNWLKRMHEDVAEPAAVLGKVLEEFMEVDREFDIERQEAGRAKIRTVLGRFGLSYHNGGAIFGAGSALPTKSLHQILKDRDLADQWRICFEWTAGSPGPVNVEIVDYH